MIAIDRPYTRTQAFDDYWFFSLEDRDEAITPHYDHSMWEKVQLPHDWSVSFGYDKAAPSGKKGGFVRTGIGYYRKPFYVDKTMLKQAISIEFDGVYMNSSVYVNGQLVGQRPYGYISFAYDINDYVVEGLNIIAVKVDCRDKAETSRWYNGCGIYRHVWLTITDKLHIDLWGTYVTTPDITQDAATIVIETDVVNGYEETKTVRIVHTIIDRAGKAVGTVADEVTIGETKQTCHGQVKVSKPHRWSIDDPYLYTCKTELYLNQHCVDVYDTRFGIRKTAYIPHKGFFLNGKHLKFKGVCIHHDAGVVGAAVPDKLLRKRLQMLKDMGCNAVRTAHNPFAPVFYDYCDELGLMVMDEVFDGWEIPKAPYDYGLYFDTWHVKDVTDWVRRDRNHPSIMLWSIGNEVHHMSTTINQELQDLVHQLDATRPVTCGVQGTSQISDDNRAILDIAGYNDGGGACFLYDEDHAKRPDQLMIATEAPHTSQTRGFYRTQTWWRDKNQPRLEIENLSEDELFFDGHLAYRSSYDNAGVRVCIRDSWTLTEERPYLMGEFRWSGFDYYGESFEWPAKWSDSGVIGVENYPKDAYYLYQSMWTTEPMIHLLPHWTHPNMPEGTPIPVWVYTNCDEAELFLNGISLGRCNRGKAKHLQWDVPYEPGRLEVIGYKNQQEVAKKAYDTAGTPATLKVTSDVDQLILDGKDVAQIDVDICDAQGVMVPHGENTLYFKAMGLVNILGTENGNVVDTTPIASKTKKAFYGKCMALVRSMNGDLINPLELHRTTTGVYAASILGEAMFKDCTQVTVDVDFINLCGQHKPSAYVIEIQLNEQPWEVLTAPIVLQETTVVKARIYTMDELLFDIEATFYKGEREKVIDLAHGNKVLNLDKPVGPFAPEMVGIWHDGQFDYDFKGDGTLTRVLNAQQEQSIGYWWYDFPLDPFEAQTYAGQGEIWFHTGEKSPMKMVSQEGQEVILDNHNKAIRRARSYPEEIVFYRGRRD